MRCSSAGREDEEAGTDRGKQWHGSTRMELCAWSCVYGAMCMLQYGAIWRRMELAHRQTEAHGHCGVMRGLAVGCDDCRLCSCSAAEIFARVYTLVCLYCDDVDVLSPAVVQ